MIRKASFSNFKSIGSIDNLELKPLTILTGYNSSGKSNILEGLYFFGESSRLIKQKNRGEHINYETVFRYGDITYPNGLENYIVYKKNINNSVKIALNFELNEDEEKEINSLNNKFNRKNKFNIESIIKEIGYSYEFNIINKKYRHQLLLNEKLMLEIENDGENNSKIVYPNGVDDKVIGTADSILNPELFKHRSGNSEIKALIDELYSPIFKYIIKKALGIYYISGERGSINAEIDVRNLKSEKQIPTTWVGHHGENTLIILSDCLKYMNKFNKITEWADKFEIGNIRSNLTNNLVLESNYRDKYTNIDLNTNLAGLGSRQILPIITQIFYSEPDDTIMIEEPEISLHPSQQVLLHELFATAIKENKQIICTTHSPFFVLAVSKIIKKKLLNLDDIVIYDIFKTKEGTKFRKLDLDINGFVKGGVESFMKVESELYKEWSDSITNDLKKE